MTRSPSPLRLASLALATTALSAGTSRAETPEPAVALADTAAFARHAMHGDVLGFGLAIDYEHYVTENLGLRVGYGAATLFGASNVNAAHGPHLAATLLLGDSSNFELSAGVGFLAANKLPPAEPSSATTGTSPPRSSSATATSRPAAASSCAPGSASPPAGAWARPASATRGEPAHAPTHPGPRPRPRHPRRHRRHDRLQQRVRRARRVGVADRRPRGRHHLHHRRPPLRRRRRRRRDLRARRRADRRHARGHDDLRRATALVARLRAVRRPRRRRPGRRRQHPGRPPTGSPSRARSTSTSTPCASATATPSTSRSRSTWTTRP